MASVVLYILIAAFAVIPAYFLSDTRDSHTCAAGRAALLRLPESIRCAQVTIFRNKALMAAIFVILAVPAILRQNVGNDYMRYVAFFHLANIDAYVPTEPGFNLLVKLIYGLCGYENSLLVFAVFSVLTIAFFLIAIRALSGRFFLSFFLFMAFGYYFQTYNTVRYYFAMSIVLCAMIFFLRKEYLPFLLLVLAAASFHKSALVVLALYPVCALKWKRIPAIVAIAAVFALSHFRDFWMQVVVRLYPSYHGTAFMSGGRISPVNIARCAALALLPFLALAMDRVVNKKNDASEEAGSQAESEISEKSPAEKPEAAGQPAQIQAESTEDSRSGAYAFWIRCTVLALVIYCAAWFIPEISRIATYLTVTQIFLIPEVILRAKEERTERVLTALTIVAGIAFFALFLWRAWDPLISILPYRTFVFHELPEAIIE